MKILLYWIINWLVVHPNPVTLCVQIIKTNPVGYFNVRSNKILKENKLNCYYHATSEIWCSAQNVHNRERYSIYSQHEPTLFLGFLMHIPGCIVNDSCSTDITHQINVWSVNSAALLPGTMLLSRHLETSSLSSPICWVFSRSSWRQTKPQP